MDQALEKEPSDLGGRPFGTFKLSVEDVEVRINTWMDSFKEKGERDGQVPTVSSLAFDLGITRRTILEYEKRDAYQAMIERAKTFCEMHIEQKLFDPKVRPAGPICNLKANFGHKDGNETTKVNFNFSWNAVQQAAQNARRMLEDPDYVSDEPVDL